MAQKKKLDIATDPNNFRLHPDKNKQAISNSLDQFGAGRSILIDNDNRAIGGNGVLEQAKEKGIPIKIIDSDGSTLFAIRRTDLSPDDPRRKGLALADNATTDLSYWDDAKLNINFDKETLLKWDINLTALTDFSEKNKEIDINGFKDEVQIVLKYSFEEHEKVKTALSKIAETPEKAIWQLLGLNEA